MTNAGYILLHRKISENPVWTSCTDATFRVFIACLLQANWKAKLWFDGKREIEIPRGSFVTSREQMAKFCRISPQQTRDSLGSLRRLQMITSQGTNRYSVITVLKYDTYQSLTEREEPAEDPSLQPAKNQGETSREPAENQPRTTTNTLKNLRREEGNKNTPAFAGSVPRIGWETDESYKPFVEAVSASGAPVIPEDFAGAYWAWSALDWEQRLERLRAFQARAAAPNWDPAFFRGASVRKFIESEWKRPIVLPRGKVDAKASATERALRLAEQQEGM